MAKGRIQSKKDTVPMVEWESGISTSDSLAAPVETYATHEYQDNHKAEAEILGPVSYTVFSAFLCLVLLVVFAFFVLLPKISER
jgi:short subunit fatty acids transporter